MGVKYLDTAGKSQVTEMGCYGIGVTRTVQSAIEQMHDKDGMIWPASIAPYLVHMCVLDKDENLIKAADGLGNELAQNGFDYLIDDRDERPGSKFKDADLIGAPLRITLGKKGYDAGEIEITWRQTKDVKKVAPAALQEEVLNACRALFKK